MPKKQHRRLHKLCILGEDPDTLDAIELLCHAEGEELIHYEVFSEVAKKLKEEKFATEVRYTLKEEKEHLKLCTQQKISASYSNNSFFRSEERETHSVILEVFLNLKIYFACVPSLSFLFESFSIMSAEGPGSSPICGNTESLFSCFSSVGSVPALVILTE
jgi:hypothetical protein